MSVSFLIDLIYFYIPGDPFKSSFWFGKDEVDPLTFPSEDLAGGSGGVGGGVSGGVLAGKVIFKEAASASAFIV